jgi:hypothetical protein
MTLEFCFQDLFYVGLIFIDPLVTIIQRFSKLLVPFEYLNDIVTYSNIDITVYGTFSNSFMCHLTQVRGAKPINQLGLNPKELNPNS